MNTQTECRDCGKDHSVESFSNVDNTTWILNGVTITVSEAETKEINNFLVRQKTEQQQAHGALWVLRRALKRALPTEIPAAILLERSVKYSDAELLEAAKEHRRGNLVSDEKIYQAQKAGYLRVDEAMNSDF